VQLTIKTEDKKTISIPARVIEGEQLGSGVEAVFLNGVTYLLASHHKRDVHHSGRPQRP